MARRANTAYDFGSWAHALRVWPELAGKDLVVLTNDSLIGPLAPLDELVRRISASTVDVWAATGNHRVADHLQSYLLAFRGGVLGRDPLAQFFGNVTQVGSKREVIEAYEIGLTRAVDSAGLTRAVGWSQADLGVPASLDPPIHAWKELLEAGFPFVKRALVTLPQFASQRAAVEDVVDRARERL